MGSRVLQSRPYQGAEPTVREQPGAQSSGRRPSFRRYQHVLQTRSIHGLGIVQDEGQDEQVWIELGQAGLDAPPLTNGIPSRPTPIDHFETVTSRHRIESGLQTAGKSVLVVDSISPGKRVTDHEYPKGPLLVSDLKARLSEVGLIHSRPWSLIDGCSSRLARHYCTKTEQRFNP